ncbi:penicillin-binding transpeptidase domain-containing protein [Cohnella panacarvi]|uniref:penicillin-binding transpeptidase domain-containing protein n=1 Tax=Cohnella panacarvi TaxID=400776 RepID=UPI00047BAD0B|nr:penicillin-binding transpeptidase domain-containing protein [Cohnella panacarvi]
MKRGGTLICGFLLLVALCGCNDAKNETVEPTPSSVPTPSETNIEESAPDQVVQAYLAKWQQRDFAGMYALLAPAAKDLIAEREFVERYERIYDGIEADRLAVSAHPDSNAGSQELSPNTSVLGFDYSVSMDSVAGPIAFEQHGRLRKSEDGGETRWLIDWKPSLIFPGMEEGDVVRVQHSSGERGEIVDRTGVGLAVNGTVPQLGIVPGKLGDDPESAKASIAENLGIAVKDIDRKLGASWVKPDLFVPIAIVPEGSEDAFADIPGVVIQGKKLRVYPLGEAAAHLTGYVGEINADELAKRKDKGYENGDYIGKAGLEQLLEDQLRGTDGIKVVLSDGKGFVKSTLAEQPAVQGKTFQLAIDAELQKTLYDELKEDASSVSAIDPKSGDILALLSTPSYDPNAFARGISRARYDAWNDDPRHPFLNRFSKAFVPGSTFKLVTAAIGLDTKSLDPNEGKKIAGLTWAKDKSWGNYYVKRVHEVGSVDLSKALLHSDNIYFAQTALEIGKTKFAEGAAKFGIGEKLPIEYPFNASQLANGAIKNEIQLADSGYGQGQVTLSALHAALIYSTLANDGHIVYPKLILTDEAKSPQVWKERAMSPETAALLKDDLVKAVASPEGVGHGTYIEGAAIAGKTGTAELKASKGVEGLEYGWFVGFDANDPRLLLSVMVEDVGKRGGSKYVTPIVKRVFESAGSKTE